MLIPKKFTLGAVEWTVKIVEDLPDKMGLTDPKTASIYIEKNSNKQVFNQVFCHELVHAMLFSTGRDNDDNPHDELLVDGMAHYLHQYLEQTDE